MPLHIAITRRVLPGREEEFQQGLREFFHRSLWALASRHTAYRSANHRMAATPPECGIYGSCRRRPRLDHHAVADSAHEALATLTSAGGTPLVSR